MKKLDHRSFVCIFALLHLGLCSQLSLHIYSTEKFIGAAETFLLQPSSTELHINFITTQIINYPSEPAIATLNFTAHNCTFTPSPSYSDLSIFSQPGIHLLYSRDKQSKSKADVSGLLRFLLSPNQNFDPLFNNEELQAYAAQIRNPDWIQGNKQISDSQTSYYYFHAIQESQFIEALALAWSSKSDIPETFQFHSFSVQLERVENHYKATVQSRFVGRLNEPYSLSPELRSSMRVTISHDCNEVCQIITLDPDSTVSHSSSPVVQPAIATRIDRKLDGSGFHRTITTQVEIQANRFRAGESCQVLLSEKLSESFFVDQYQVDELFKFGGKTQVHLDHVIDLEKPAYESSQNVVLTTQSCLVNEERKILLTFELPIHYRYQKPSNQSHMLCPIPPPTIFIKSSSSEWEPVELHTNVGDIYARIPAGKLKHAGIVEKGTIIVTVLGALVVVVFITKEYLRSTKQ